MHTHCPMFKGQTHTWYHNNPQQAAVVHPLRCSELLPKQACFQLFSLGVKEGGKCVGQKHNTYAVQSGNNRCSQSTTQKQSHKQRTGVGAVVICKASNAVEDKDKGMHVCLYAHALSVPSQNLRPAIHQLHTWHGAHAAFYTLGQSHN